MSTSLSDYPGGQFLKKLDDVEVEDKRVFVRVDFNVPMKDGVITDDTRIRAALPTIKNLIERDAKLIIASHLGRPKGEVNPKYSLEPVAAHLGELLGKDALFSHDLSGLAVIHSTKELRKGGLLVLENLRFHPGEEKNSSDLAVKLSQLAEVYINDAFGTCHRAHCSVNALPKMMPKRACGYLLEKEISSIGTLMHNPPRPQAAILGGAKVSDKMKVIEALMTKCSKIFVGGAMAYTFLRALDVKTGKSLVETDLIEHCKKMLDRAAKAQCKIYLPVDHCLADSFDNPGVETFSENAHIPNDKMALDIGPKTIELFTRELQGVKSIFWNGPMGVFERPPFDKGTMALAEALAELDAPVKICGGGDSVSALNKSGKADDFSHVSTGGGASLEMIEGVEMPGIEALKIYPNH